MLKNRYLGGMRKLHILFLRLRRGPMETADELLRFRDYSIRLLLAQSCV
jgi:hypothetical protein